ncbi:MAG: sulfurtransferase FdhD [Polaromonas sp. 39-63-203]|jgi:FdhD protein|uniref:formate dehydrogenase accessory sulfurtransferase FdhD n=1 Tax=Polaromonas sp. TaxID=1869339 RepID=UPI000BC81371|nr:formate dehydrogenase accessory sulfurtransferase FdhD [Polaromonas sp.]OYY52299.1 MAG: sulfurtransferase FdhD [Polaromonas sp. 35-63-240]OYY97309.1 MAG: sulfurtransferase FdhD [Polaromonas sp. 28-63-22]OYZ83703.1 MAG: sulfurtransferase FdhD [Polaromonas sp. 24-62-144]OZA97975.1 MAG: sulfurtransferase FdhD [Polaromonas sp. 39-63-203]HQS32270.1 formate dehydrogenase accessory sulfurtransferase FdhD [Polaromonas sp.]
MTVLLPVLPLPWLTRAEAPLTCEIDVVNEHGEHLKVAIPAERALTVYVDKRELVTLMTLGAHPEWLVLGYLRNQRLVRSVHDIESITVDWDVGAAAVKTRHGIDDIEEKTARRVVTTGCGQGSVFGGLMDEVDQLRLPPHAALSQGQLYSLVNTIRLKETTYKSAGSVHACALFDTGTPEPDMLLFVEDVGRHNAIDTIAGWMWMHRGPALVASRTSLPPEGAVGRGSEPANAGLGGLQRGCDTQPGGLQGLRLRPGPSTSSGQAKAGSAAPACEDGTAAPGASPTNIGSERHVFYTTGRLTSEMVIKSAQMGVAIVVSRSGITQMGHQVAQSVGLCAIGRATNKRFVCYASPERLQMEPHLAHRAETMAPSLG